jgi:UDP-N-acetylglucosamine:LPS N-acetylglucosamine transferase
MGLRVELVYFNAGGGHRASALALQQAIEAAGLGWDVQLVNLTELLDPEGRLRRLAFSPEDYYNARLAHGLTLGLHAELRVLQGLIALLHPTLVRALCAHWRRSAPDLVVSLIPNFNRALNASLREVHAQVPYVTVLTDLADHPPHFWIEPALDQHVVCGTPHAVRQALAAGCAPQRVHATSGMIIRPDFYAPAAASARVARRAELGLDAHAPTAVVMFGGHGSRSMVGIAERMSQHQMILLCGHNAALRERLLALPEAAPRAVLGFTPDVAGLLRAGDYFIGKPGPGALSEALQLGLPVIVTRNAWTMPQERYNTQWVVEHGYGRVLRSFREVEPAARELCAQLPAYRERVAGLRNRAVFEVPQILQRIVADAPRGVRAAA